MVHPKVKKTFIELFSPVNTGLLAIVIGCFNYGISTIDNRFDTIDTHIALLTIKVDAQSDAVAEIKGFLHLNFNQSSKNLTGVTTVER